MLKIKNPYCVFNHFIGNAHGYGKIIAEDGVSVTIKDSEKLSYPFQWNIKFVKRFAKLEKAVEYYIENRPQGTHLDREIPEHEIWEEARKNFPSYFRKKKNYAKRN